MNSLRVSVLVLCCAFLLGCSTNRQSPGNAELSYAYSSLAEQRLLPRSQTELEHLHRIFQKLDELPGIWETALFLSQFPNAETSGRRDWAQLSLDTARTIGQQKAMFLSLLAMYQVTGDNAYLDDSSRYMSTEYQRNQYYFLANQWQKIQLQEESNYSQGQLAHVLYWLARQCHCEGRLQEAYQLFKQTNNSGGLGDILFFRATLVLENGQKALARSLAIRALRIFRVSGRSARVAVIEQWIKDNELVG